MPVLTREDPEIYQMWTVSQENHNGWPKEKPKEIPLLNDLTCHADANQGLSL